MQVAVLEINMSQSGYNSVYVLFLIKNDFYYYYYFLTKLSCNSPMLMREGFWDPPFIPVCFVSCVVFNRLTTLLFFFTPPYFPISLGILY